MAPAEKPSDAPSDSKPVPPEMKGKKAQDKPEDELSEEDLALKEKLELLVTRVKDSDPGVQKLALDTIRTEIRSATSSMTSVPKPLKFLRSHFAPLKDYYAAMSDSEVKVYLADVLSVLAMTMGDSSRCESLRFKLRGSTEAPHLWGHEYVRHLAGEIAQEYRAIDLEDVMQDDTPADDEAALPYLKQATVEELSRLVSDIVPFLITSNAEPEAVDLLMEVDSLSLLASYVDEHNYNRVCLYLKSCADYLPEQEDVEQLLTIAVDIYRKVKKLPDAMQVAIRKNDMELIKAIYLASEEQSTTRLQLALDLGRANILLDEDVEPDDDLRAAMSNRKLSPQFLALAKDLDVLEPKTPEDIYKTHLLDSRAPAASSNVDSARANLAKTFVNAFVNMGFGADKLMADTKQSWIYRNKEHGMMSAAASVGMILLWDVDAGLAEIDKYFYVNQNYVCAGAMLAVGLVSANVRHEVDPTLAMLQEHITSEVPCRRHGAITGLGLAYAGTQKEEIKELLSPILVDGEVSADTASLAALSLGLTFIGSADEDLSEVLLQVMLDRSETGDATKEPLFQILVPLAFGFLFLGRQESTTAVAETITAVVGENSLMSLVSSITLQACAYCGSGRVLIIQKFLSICGEHPAHQNEDEAANESGSTSNNTNTNNANGTARNGTTENANSSGSGDANARRSHSSGSAESNSESNANGDAADASAANQNGGENNSNTSGSSESQRLSSAQQAVAVLGLAMVAMGEELGAEMLIRTFGHLLQYGDPVIRRVVPLAVGLLSVSNPKLALMDLLSKFTHDSDMDVAQSAIIGLGLIGAGTNNSRIAGILRQLSVYYSKEPSCLFLVRIAQGLLHAGKGLVTMNPLYGDRFLSSKTALGGLLTVLFCCLDMKSTILGKNHFLLYYLALACRPRMLFTVDEKSEFKATSVRVGQAVDTVGQAGRPKSITGFQTHTTPVLLAAGERAEMATEEFLTKAASMEGVVVLEKNPDWVEESGLAEAAEKMDQDKGNAVEDIGGSSVAGAGAGPSSQSGGGDDAEKKEST